jgi:hypothetical protein
MDQVGQLYFFNFANYAFIYFSNKLWIWTMPTIEAFTNIYKYDLHIITHFSHDVLCKNYVDEDMQMQMWLTKCTLKNSKLWKLKENSFISNFQAWIWNLQIDLAQINPKKETYKEQIN